MMTRLMQLIHELTKKGIHSTKRDLFYSDVKLFEKQIQSDHILEELALMFGCTRHSLQVTASEKGLVVGRIQFDDDADFIDCTKMGRSGKNIPSYIDRVSNIKSDYDRPAEFILLVEKDAAFQRLAEDRFYNTYPCIIITVCLKSPLFSFLFPLSSLLSPLSFFLSPLSSLLIPLSSLLSTASLRNYILPPLV